MGEFRMPSLGADMDAGTVSKWLVHPGDEVRRGDIVAVVETEKSTIEVEVFESGRVEELVVAEGERVPVGTVLARLSPLGAPAEAAAAADHGTVVSHDHGIVVSHDNGTVVSHDNGTVVSHDNGIVVSPVLRHLADTLGVDLTSVAGSGPGGRVTRQDVESAPHVAPPPVVAVRPTEEGRASPGRPASPRARRLASELGVDLDTVHPSGPGGSVVGEDVRRASAASDAGRGPTLPETAPAPAPKEPAEAQDGDGATARQLAMRHAIGALMARSKREIPHYYLRTTIDMHAALSWLEAENARRSITARLVAPVLLLKATALAVATVPEMNGSMVGDRFEPAERVHVGVAISLRGGGLVAPAIHDADRLPLDDLMASLRDLVTRARRGVLRSSEMSDPTLTVTNLGELGVDEVFGVIYPPQVALVGFGRIAERPWADHGMVGVRPLLTATLSADHRASDGHRGGLFLSTIDQLLQAPEAL